MKPRAWLLPLFLLLFVRLDAQPEFSYIIVENITVEGNKKTRTHYILREMFMQTCDTISLADLNIELERNRLQLMNTGLFVQAEVQTRNWDLDARTLDIVVRVTEAWYIYPLPIFELADRNFNTWWDDYDRSLRRINYGIRFHHNNLTGRRDLLKATLQFGFTNKYQLVYELPFFDKKQRWGLAFKASYSRNKEINFGTIDDHQQFFRESDHVLLQQFSAGASATLRRKRQVTHIWEMTHYRNQIHPTVRDDLNADYYLGSIRQRYTTLAYEFTADTRDIRPYPVNGGFMRLRLQKDGLAGWEDVNALHASALLKKYFPLSRRWSVELIGAGRLALIREKQPFANSQALGYGANYIRGYEYYVIDGLDYAYQKTSIRFRLLDRRRYLGNLMPFKNLKTLTYRLYITGNNDLGFANNPYYAEGNQLANKLLWGYGLGLDLVAYYNNLFRVEFTRNYLGENGVFLHWATRF